jgi:hypothetical protein
MGTGTQKSSRRKEVAVFPFEERAACRRRNRLGLSSNLCRRGSGRLCGSPLSSPEALWIAPVLLWDRPREVSGEVPLDKEENLRSQPPFQARVSNRV